MISASHVMTRNMITLSATVSAGEALRTLLRHKISSAPVVDDDGRLLGTISEFQLLKVIYQPKLAEQKVAELMTRDTVAVEEDMPLVNVADKFIFHHIRRLPVVNNARLVGLISHRDLLSFAVSDEPESLDQWFCLLVDNAHSE